MSWIYCRTVGAKGLMIIIKSYKDYRIIGLSNVMTHILTRRLQKNANEQFGFKKVRGTRDAMGVLRTFQEILTKLNKG